MSQPNLPKGIKIAFSNTPQAKDDQFAFGEIIEANVQYLNVMGNDLGGNAKSLYSLDDSINSGGINGDLLQQDAVNAIAYSYLGARLWITSDGKVAYDASTLDLDALGAGQHLTDTFTYAIRMANGAISWATATVDIVGTNDGPVITSGPQSGTAKEDDVLSVSGQVTASDSDAGDHQHYSGDAAGTFGTFTVNASTGSWTYTLNNSAANVQALAQGETHDEVFTVTVTDDFGATAAQDVTIHVTGTNDAPVITNGPQSGTVTEDAAVTQATGHLDVVDPDHNATQSWSVVGGSTSGTVDYEFRADSFTITRFGNPLLQDDFSDGLPPPNSPNFVGNLTPTTYVTNGSFTESGGKITLDSDNAVSFVSVGTPDPLVGQVAIARTNFNPATPTAGLRQNAPFTIEGIFDLILPDSPREAYGIRATDRLVGGTGPGVPPDDLGDDTYDLTVRENIFGQDVVQLRHIDFVNDVTTLMGSFVISAPSGADQIRLVFAHTTGSTDLQASFQYWSSISNSQVGSTQSFASVAPVFAADSVDTQAWVRGGVIAYAPLFTDSILSGTYGTMNINQAGNWTYTLNNALATTQSLAQGQTDTDTFTVTVADEFGATDDTTVTVNVTGSNDAPIMQTAAVSRSLTEDQSSPDLTATGLAQFSDVDLTDAHTIAASLQSATLSSGGPLPAGLSALLASAMSATEVNASLGDGHGEIQWDFALANNAIQFLDAGETLTAVYNVNATDPFGATATQAVTVTIAGADDNIPVVDLVAAYRVGEGAYWGGNPPVYTAREAAAFLFGGNASDYSISTTKASITHTGWYDGWGKPMTVFNEDFEQDAPPAGYYEPFGDAWSALVGDHVSVQGFLNSVYFSYTPYDNYAWTNYVYRSVNIITGTSGSEPITGTAVSDKISGAGGSDVLTGGGGADSFVFNTPSEGGAQITDFNPLDDLLLFNASGFGGGLQPGGVGSQQFASGSDVSSGFTSTLQRFFFDTDPADHALWFDADGSGGAHAATKIVSVDPSVVLHQNDLIIL